MPVRRSICASKGGVVILTKALRWSWRRAASGALYSICPGDVSRRPMLAYQATTFGKRQSGRLSAGAAPTSYPQG